MALDLSVVFRRNTKDAIQEERIAKLDFSNLKNFCVKDIKRMKRQVIEKI